MSELPADSIDALRSATREHHERVDRLMDVERMREPAHYARVLQVLHAFLAGWEPRVAAALPARRSWLHARSRLAFLEADLHAMDVAVPAPAQVPALDDAASAWGSVYVIEGSALGGQVISRLLAGTGSESAASYFRGWGEATGRMWREVRQLLASELATPAATARACDAARQTFDTLAHLLEGKLHERTPAA